MDEVKVDRLLDEFKECLNGGDLESALMLLRDVEKELLVDVFDDLRQLGEIRKNLDSILKPKGDR